MDEFTQMLQEATEGVRRPYFQLPIDGGDPIYRERVYCYELYHQMRKRPLGQQLFVMGEVDKVRHPVLSKLDADYAKPDLLVHLPGSMSGNFAIIEVKGPAPRPEAIRKDLRTLRLFRSAANYQRAIYLFFGPGAVESSRKIIEQYPIPEEGGVIVELWAHRTEGMPATLVGAASL